MNLQKLFKTQRVLEEHINAQHPLQEGEDRLSKKILALQVELGELANEWRGFKFWSNNQEPRTEVKRICHVCRGKGSRTTRIVPEIEKESCLYCGATGWEENRNPLLEEYVDCLHFALSIGIELQIYNFNFISINSQQPTMDLFMEVMAFTTELYWHHQNGATGKEKDSTYKSVLYHLLDLGQTLGFEWEQIQQAYYAKNKVNHERQESGY